ncbi:MAG: FtsX-like permease family protein [Acidobacteria bacterium]|nr:FtsX-like permease family protein [Acidobacteriota bacterium]
MPFDQLRQDLTYTARAFRRDPGFFGIAALIVGLGIGASTAVFSVVDAVLWRPLPFEQPERLVRVANTGGSGLSSVTSRSSNLRDWRKLNRTFEDLAGYFAFFDYERFTLREEGEAERLVGVGVTETFLPMLGVEPALGRGFTSEECAWGGPGAILLTHRFWQRRFGGEAGVVGRTLRLNDQAMTVVGVLPDSFDFASIFSPGARIDFLRPFPVADQTDRWGNTLAVIGRLKPDVGVGQAQSDLDRVNERLHEEDPRRWGLGAKVSDLREHITGNFRDSLTLLAAAVGLVLLITCTNLSNLLLARAASRRREVAVRSALGAGKMRLVRQMLTESLTLAAAGGLLGVTAAYLLTRAAAATEAVTIPLLRTVETDAAALGFAFAATLATGLLFGLVPALRLSGEHESLRDAGRGMSESKGRGWLRGALVVSEVALALVLLVGAGLLLRSFLALLDTDLGFRPEQRIAWRVETNRDFDTLTQRVSFYDQMVRAVRNLPGVTAVGLTDTLPLGRNREWGMGAKGEVYADGEYPSAFPRMISPGYFDAMGIQLVEGRGFTPNDTEESEPVVVVNETMAEKLWPGRNPIGAVLVNNRDWTVVGVAANVRHSSLEEEGGLEVYFPMAQQGDWGAVDLVLETTLPAESMVASVRQALGEVDPLMPTSEYQTLDAIVDRAASPRRFLVSLLGAFALAAVVLALLGIYGVVSYSVGQRRREIGIRMALGATDRNVRLQVLRRTLALAALGIAIGVAGALALTRVMGSLLYGVGAMDPVTFAAAVGLLLLTALAAGYLPALRASRVHPATVLQES